MADKLCAVRHCSSIYIPTGCAGLMSVTPKLYSQEAHRLTFRGPNGKTGNSYLCNQDSKSFSVCKVFQQQLNF